jgi:hypothetical protein
MLTFKNPKRGQLFRVALPQPVSPVFSKRRD